MILTRSTFLVFTTVSAVFFTALPAIAADKEPVVVVTPTKSTRPVDKVPYAVSVVSRRNAQSAQAQSADDLLREIPNFSSAGGPRSLTEEPSLRGLSDRRIVIKVDGIRRNFRAQYGGRYFFDPMLTDRVEVVRGANSAIDGSGAIAGTIQFFTPTTAGQLAGSPRNWGTETQFGYQSVNQEFATLLSGYTQQDNVDLYGAFTTRNSDDIRAGDGSTIRPSSEQPDNTLLKAGYTFNPNHRIEFRYARFYDESDLPVTPFQPASTINSPTKRKSAVTDYSAHYRLAPEAGNKFHGIMDVNAIVYHSDYDIKTRRLSDGRFDQTTFETTGTDVYNTANAKFLGADHKITTGVEYFTNQQSGRRNGAFRPLLGDGEDSNLGVYLQQETVLFDRLTIIPGVRYDHYELKPQNATLPSQDRDQVSPKIGVNYELDDNWSGYASWASAFRTPTLTELYATGTLFPGNTLISNPNLKPETAENREIGVRYKAEGLLKQYDSLRITVSGFDNQVDDYIEQVIGTTQTQFRNVSQAELRGIELEAKYRIDQYAFGFYGGHIRGENKTQNVPLADVPQNQYSLSFERSSADNQWLFGTRVNHLEAQDRIPPNQPLITTSKAATTLDIYGTWVPPLKNNETGAVTVNFGVDNVTDVSYRRQLAFVPEPGRNAKVSLNWKF
jgi:hemoglobin/transferrin/lactoferrin receptor protein